MTRRALPFLMVAAAITAVSGCTCSGDVSRFPVVTTPPGGDGGNIGNPDGGNTGNDGGPNVDICQIIVCPPQVDGGFSGTIDFPPDGGFSLDGGVGTGGDGVTVDPRGRITLNSQDIQINYAWIANWKMGTVSKFDTRNALPDGGIHEVGRYISVFPLDGLGRRNHSSSASVYDPSRTAIDINGDMWVANFASHAGEYFSVTKVAGSLFNCIDRNGNGKIDTSFDDPTDVAGYGVIQPNEYLNPTDPNNPLQYDECVLFTQELGDLNATGRFGEGSISIAAAPEGGPGDVWVGTWIDRRVWRLDPFNGTPKAIPAGPNVASLPDGGGQYIGVPSIEPYGSAVDRKNRLWIVDRVRNNLAVIDTNIQTLLSGFITPPSTYSPRSGYGIAVDQQGRVWIPGWGSGPNVTRYDPGTGAIDAGTWTKFSFPTLVSPIGSTITSPRGITVDDQGIVWVDSDQRGGDAGTGSAAMVWGFDGDAGTVYQFNPPSGSPNGLIDATSTWSKTSIGVGLDQDRNLWVNNSSGNVMRIDRVTGAVTTSPNQAGALYTYSDFTGYQLRHITLSQGSFTQTVAGCSRYAEWDTVSWNAIVNPPNTSVVLFVRGSNNTDFSVSQQYGPFSGPPACSTSGTTTTCNLQVSPGPVPQFKYIQLQFLLTSKDGTSQPYLLNFDVTSKCLTPLQ